MFMGDYSFESEPRLLYGEDGACFIRRCEKCFRFVKADKEIILTGRGLSNQHNATCSKCGHTNMIFEGFY